jgi:hypothetical protein
VVRDAEDARALERMLNGAGHFFYMADGFAASTSLSPHCVFRSTTVTLVSFPVVFR